MDYSNKPVIFLTKEELLHLYNFKIPKNGEKIKLLDMYGKEYEKVVEDAGGMEKTRDCFCFCAFTSLRYSDLANQLMNRYLKNLCELAGFNKPITRTCYRAGQRVEETFPKYEMIGTHAGRRTFICFALSSGIPPQVVMKWTGHSDYQAMKPYIAIAEKTKADAMKLFDEELKK